MLAAKIKHRAAKLSHNVRAAAKSLRKEGKWCIDRRQMFHDLSRVSPEDRQRRSPFLQFYSSANNIGNYLPVLGIREMLGETPDVWCMHDRHIDFEYVNDTYKGIIIGGAGLLYKCFEPFWTRFSEECHLPTIMWGIGVCAPDTKDDPGVPKASVASVASRCDLINVRDDLTARWYDLSSADISPCPTLAYIENASFEKPNVRDKTLFSMHRQTVPDDEIEAIENIACKLDHDIIITDNDQTAYRNIDDLIEEVYAASRIVMTTRLHGAIISYALGIPYVAFARDEKVRSFHARYSNGVIVERVEDIVPALQECELKDPVTAPADFASVRAFGSTAREWCRSLR